MGNILEMAQTFVVTYGMRIIGSLVIFLVGRWIANTLANATQRMLNRSQTDKTLIGFAKTLVYYVIFVFAILAALRNLGVETTSFVALIGAAGLAIGLALEGALSNFAAGVLLLVFRPFKVGDLVEIAGSLGHVEEMQIFSTIVITLDNKTAIIPNSAVTGGSILNYSRQGLLRLDMVFGIGYNDDLLKAKEILLKILTDNDQVATEPAPLVAVTELADSSVNFAVRPYVTPDDYWDVYFHTHEQVKLRLDEAGISIPFPQQDVHMHQVNGSG